MDFGCVIRFMERSFKIKEGALTFADSRSTGDLRPFFVLSNPPRAFQPINAPLSATDFLIRFYSGAPNNGRPCGDLVDRSLPLRHSI